MDLKKNFPPAHQKPIGLVLTGGGARGAYQAGALKGISELAHKWKMQFPFPILSGCSAGAINAAYLATHADEGHQASLGLAEIWNNLSIDQVYRDDIFSLLKTGMKWLMTLSMGGLTIGKKTIALLDTAPLKQLLAKEIPMDRLEKYIESGLVHSLAITVVNYSTGCTQTYFQGHKDLRSWHRVRREGLPATLTLNHVLASSAIPMLFPPVPIGPCYYGDGNVRNYTPFSPAINLGAKKILVIGVKKAPQEIVEKNQPSPSLARILSVLMNTILLDSVDLDLERLQRINQTLQHIPGELPIPLKKIEICIVRPSENIGKMAISEVDGLPRTLRHLIRGLGTEEEASELTSYLLFIPSFTKKLVELGYRDALKQEEELRQFLMD